MVEGNPTKGSSAAKEEVFRLIKFVTSLGRVGVGHNFVRHALLWP